MRHAKNFQPEWGYLAPAPSFMRTAPIVLVAMAVGATASAGVLLSLIDRPVAAIGETSVAARTLARPFEADPVPVSTPQAAQVETPALIEDWFAKPGAANMHGGVLAASEPNTISTAEVPANVAAMAEPPAMADAPRAKIADATTPAATPSVGKSATERNRSPSRSPWWGKRGSGSLAFLKPFKTRGYNRKGHLGWY